jgi:hypothetical protein
MWHSVHNSTSGVERISVHCIAIQEQNDLFIHNGACTNRRFIEWHEGDSKHFSRIEVLSSGMY